MLHVKEVSVVHKFLDIVVHKFLDNAYFIILFNVKRILYQLVFFQFNSYVKNLLQAGGEYVARFHFHPANWRPWEHTTKQISLLTMIAQCRRHFIAKIRLYSSQSFLATQIMTLGLFVVVLRAV